MIIYNIATIMLIEFTLSSKVHNSNNLCVISRNKVISWRSLGKNPIVSCDIRRAYFTWMSAWGLAPFLEKLFFMSVGKIWISKGNIGSHQIFSQCPALGRPVNTPCLDGCRGQGAWVSGSSQMAREGSECITHARQCTGHQRVQDNKTRRQT